jgi:hypothetical protein
MKSRKVISLFCLLIFMAGCRKGSEPEKNPLGFPFKIVSAKTETLAESTSWDIVDVVLLRENFSEENVDKLFRYFLQQYPEQGRLYVRVYTSMENYQESLKITQEERMGWDTGSDPFFDATLTGGRDDEFYMYNPTLDHHLLYTLDSSNRDQVKIVHIKGSF